MKYIITTLILIFNTSLIVVFPLHDDNLTGLIETHRIICVCWSLASTGVIFYLVLPYNKYVYKSRTWFILSLITWLSLLITLITPYQPTQYPLLTFSHLFFAYLFFTAMSAILIKFIYHFYLINQAQALLLLKLSCLSIILCTYQFIKFSGINGVLEIIITNTMIIFSLILNHYMSTTNKPYKNNTTKS